MTILTIWDGWTVISSIGSLIAAIVAILYTYYTYHLLQKSKETLDKANDINEFQIYKEISNSISSEEFTNIFDGCLKNNMAIIINGTATEKDQISSDKINRNLLNPLEDIAIFWKKGLISTATINSGFGYKILKVGSCKAIKEHIINVRENLPGVYEGLEELYQAIYKISTPSEKEGHSEFIVEQIKTIQ